MSRGAWPSSCRLAEAEMHCNIDSEESAATGFEVPKKDAFNGYCSDTMISPSQA